MRLPTQPGAVLIDLAGVLHVGTQAIPGAPEALERLRANSLPLRFLTNTTRSPRHDIVALLRGLGFDIDADEIHTAARATHQLVEQRGSGEGISHVMAVEREGGDAAVKVEQCIGKLR